MKSLSNNQELYDYLLHLVSELNGRGFLELGEAVAFASRHASGLSTEFLGESRIALRRVAKEENGALTEPERAALLGVLKQLDEALDKR
jgi:hypothetical protein